MQPSNRIIKPIVFFSLLLFINTAFAQTGENPVAGGIQWLVSQFYGPLGLGLATLAIMSVGLLCWGHVLEWKRLIQTVVGVAIVFGAGAIVSLIKSAIGGGGG